MWYVRDRRVRVYERAARLQDSRTRRVEFVVRMNEEQHVERLLKDRVRRVVLFPEMIHLVQEPSNGRW